MSQFVTDEQCSLALDYYRDNAEELGALKGRVAVADHYRKVTRGQMVLISEQSTDSKRIADAESSANYRDAIEEIENATTELHTLQTKMKAAELKIEVWRSLNSRANRGHV